MQKDKRNGRITAALIILFVLMLVLVVLNISIGSYSIPADKIISVFRDGPTAEAGSLISTMYAILHQIRLPRLLACLILGGALGLAGFLLQTFFGNPIAGPYVLGISSGAKLTVALTMVFVMQASGGLSSAFTIMAAFVGAMVSMGFVLIISQKVNSASMLIVSGVMVGYICSAITEIVVTFADDSNIVNLHNWSLGTFSGSTWSDVASAGSVVALAVTASSL